MARRIAVFIPNLCVGGAEKVALNLSEALSQQGFEVDLLLAVSTGPFQKDVHPSVRVVDLGCRRTITAVLPLRHYIRTEQPEMLISHLSRANVVTLLATRLLSTSTTITLVEHSTPRPATTFRGWVIKKLMGFWYKKADHVVAASDGNARDLERATGLPDGTVKRIYNPIVSDSLLRLAAQSTDHPWAQPSDIPLVVTLGRLAEVKDHETLLKAHARLRERRSCRLIIIGSGPLQENLQTFVEENGLADCTQLAGFVENPYALMRAASLFVLSSKTEALPTALVEALACGCSCVATDCPQGPDEILLHGDLGILVPVGDHEAMAAAMEQALDNPTPAERLTSRAAEFTFSDCAKAYAALLDPHADRN